MSSQNYGYKRIILGYLKKAFKIYKHGNLSLKSRSNHKYLLYITHFIISFFISLTFDDELTNY